MAPMLLDTNIFIYFLNSEKQVLQFFDRISEDSIPYYSFINRLELMALPEISDIEIEKINALLNEFYRIDYNFFIEAEVITIRKSKRIKIPDAIIAASAIYTKSVLVTRNTKDFQSIKNLKLFNPFEDDLSAI